MHSKTRLALAAALVARGVLGAPMADTFDYIIVGSGPGGGPLACNLARAGYSTLLLEAGDDQGDNPNSANMFNFVLADNDPLTRWDFFVKNSEDPARELKNKKMVYRQTDGEFYTGLSPPAGAKQLGVWYPRAGTLGGCAMHNAGVTALPAEADWDVVANRTGDASWAGVGMAKYWYRLEKNLMLPAGTAGHGYEGWLDTSTADMSWATTGDDGRTILSEIAKATGQDPAQLGSLIARDLNDASDPHRDQAVGYFNMVSHADKQGMRSSPNNYIRATLRDPAKYPLTVKLNSLVTRVLFDDAKTAVGVEVLEGANLYSADPRFTTAKKGAGTKITYKAAKEVILAAGVFNTPQLLKLSGVGPAAELARFNIPLVKDLPGVGENMADNYEASLISLASRPLTFMGPPVALMMKTSKGVPNRNIYAWCGQFSFEGFWPGFPTNYGPNQWECALCHMNPKSQAGYVRLTSADPQDMPDINLRFFEHREDEDLTEILEAIKTIRSGLNVAGNGLAPWDEVHPCPGKGSACTDAEQKDYIKMQAYSHHATSSCAIGGDSDPMAVLDSKFRVRGVKNLRVVDGSAFPSVPGAFPVLPTYMLAEKATEDILAGAKP